MASPYFDKRRCSCDDGDQAATATAATAAATAEQSVEVPQVEGIGEAASSAAVPATEPRGTRRREIDNSVVEGMRAQFIEDSLDDNTLPGFPSPQKLAEQSETFLGQHFRYRMNDLEHRKNISGDYIIVYTRPLGQSTGAQNDPYTKVYKLNPMTRKITVYGEHRAATADDNPQNWGRAEIHLKGQKNIQNVLHAGILFDRIHEHDNTIVQCSATAMQGREDYETTDLLDWILHQGINNDQTHVSFGFKFLGSDPSAPTAPLGLNFIEIKLPFFNIELDAFDTQLIIAAKLPSRRDIFDLPSRELFWQPVYLPRNHETYVLVTPPPTYQTLLPKLAPRPPRPEAGEASGSGSGVGMMSGSGGGAAEGEMLEPRKYEATKYQWRTVGGQKSDEVKNKEAEDIEMKEPAAAEGEKEKYVWKTVTAKNDNDPGKGKGPETVVDEAASGTAYEGENKEPSKYVWQTVKKPEDDTTEDPDTKMEM
ncbi:hypothetical protein HYFRA_00010617 [Hymenoscyphus fraxineus]|uniref:Uncharacterized protein n=1 Tax=Hymenoscyphus fraxineus TaxID=746836 RepID=A0A9N9L8R2_9HELO|nr:hypothetical protein HYFRA_00010617 [Hymenoscyphus fraxineus]